VFRGDRKSKTVDAPWPTYRHDALRSGATAAAVPTELKCAWQTQLDGRLSSLVAAEGKLFVAEVDRHSVCAVAAASGKLSWRFTAGGRVDSPPTYHAGAVLFGSADGWVYCLRAADGEVAWRFRVAPADRRIMAFEQVESLWPMHGSVLVQDGVAWCLAGRSMFLDGGMRLVRLDAATGAKLSETVLDDRDPATGKNLQAHINRKKMPVALPDVLSSDGKVVYMRSQRFDMTGKRATILPESQANQDGHRHVFSPIGMLDDTWFHRAYMFYGRNAGEGWGEWFLPARQVPYGRMLVTGDDTVYAYGRHPWYLCNSSVLEYRLYAAEKEPAPAAPSGPAARRGQTPVAKKPIAKKPPANRPPRKKPAAKRPPAKRRRPAGGIPRNTTDWKSRSNFPISRLTRVRFKWVAEQPPLLARAMVLAGKTLFVAGPPDVDDEFTGWGHHLDGDVAAKHVEQADALAGKKGGLLWAVSAADGAKLAEYRLDSPPVFDGMIAADGKLYFTTMDGKVACWHGK